MQGIFAGNIHSRQGIVDGLCITNIDGNCMALQFSSIFHEDTLVKREDAGSFLESGLTIATDQKAPLQTQKM